MSAEKELVTKVWGYRPAERTRYFSFGHPSALFGSRSILDVNDTLNECVGAADMYSLGPCLGPS